MFCLKSPTCLAEAEAVRTCLTNLLESYVQAYQALQTPEDIYRAKSDEQEILMQESVAKVGISPTKDDLRAFQKSCMQHARKMDQLKREFAIKREELEVKHQEDHEALFADMISCLLELISVVKKETFPHPWSHKEPTIRDHSCASCKSFTEESKEMPPQRFLTPSSTIRTSHGDVAIAEPPRTPEKPAQHTYATIGGSIGSDKASHNEHSQTRSPRNDRPPTTNGSHCVFRRSEHYDEFGSVGSPLKHLTGGKRPIPPQMGSPVANPIAAKPSHTESHSHSLDAPLAADSDSVDSDSVSQRKTSSPRSAKQTPKRRKTNNSVSALMSSFGRDEQSQTDVSMDESFLGATEQLSQHDSDTDDWPRFEQPQASHSNHKPDRQLPKRQHQNTTQKADSLIITLPYPSPPLATNPTTGKAYMTRSPRTLAYYPVLLLPLENLARFDINGVLVGRRLAKDLPEDVLLNTSSKQLERTSPVDKNGKYTMARSFPVISLADLNFPKLCKSEWVEATNLYEFDPEVPSYVTDDLRDNALVILKRLETCDGKSDSLPTRSTPISPDPFASPEPGYSREESDRLFMQQLAARKKRDQTRAMAAAASSPVHCNPAEVGYPDHMELDPAPDSPPPVASDLAEPVVRENLSEMPCSEASPLNDWKRESESATVTPTPQQQPPPPNGKMTPIVIESDTERSDDDGDDNDASASEWVKPNREESHQSSLSPPPDSPPTAGKDESGWERLHVRAPSTEESEWLQQSTASESELSRPSRRRLRRRMMGDAKKTKRRRSPDHFFDTDDEPLGSIVVRLPIVAENLCARTLQQYLPSEQVEDDSIIDIDDMQTPLSPPTADDTFDIQPSTLHDTPNNISSLSGDGQYIHTVATMALHHLNDTHSPRGNDKTPTKETTLSGAPEPPVSFSNSIISSITSGFTTPYPRLPSLHLPEHSIPNALEALEPPTMAPTGPPILNFSQSDIGQQTAMIRSSRWVVPTPRDYSTRHHHYHLNSATGVHHLGQHAHPPPFITQQPRTMSHIYRPQHLTYGTSSRTAPRGIPTSQYRVGPASVGEQLRLSSGELVGPVYHHAQPGQLEGAFGY